MRLSFSKALFFVPYTFFKHSKLASVGFTLLEQSRVEKTVKLIYLIMQFRLVTSNIGLSSQLQIFLWSKSVSLYAAFHKYGTNGTLDQFLKHCTALKSFSFSARTVQG